MVEYLDARELPKSFENIDPRVKKNLEADLLFVREKLEDIREAVEARNLRGFSSGLFYFGCGLGMISIERDLYEESGDLTREQYVDLNRIRDKLFNESCKYRKQLKDRYRLELRQGDFPAYY